MGQVFWSLNALKEEDFTRNSTVALPFHFQYGLD